MELVSSIAPQEVELEDASENLRSVLEALLLVVDSPVSARTLAVAAESDPELVSAELQAWAAELNGRASGMELRQSGEGWRLYTRARYAPYVEKLLTDGSRASLTRAALETLAVVAYRQPVTRARVAAVRGVNVDGVIRTLVARGMIVECGRDDDTSGILYRTTELFLERLGIGALEDLPDIAPLLPGLDVVDDMSDRPEDDTRSTARRRNRENALAAEGKQPIPSSSHNGGRFDTESAPTGAPYDD